MKTKYFKNALFAIMSCIIAVGCEVNDGDLPTPPDTTEPPVVINSLELLASSPQLQSDGSTKVTLTAFAKDENNQVMEGIRITFAADSGTLVVADSVTTEQGVASAELSTGGDPTNRTITVTATAITAGAEAPLTDSVAISVIGSSLQIQGPNSLVTGASGDYTAILTDSGGVGIAGKTIEVTSSNGNTINATSLETDVNGRIQFTLTGNASGSDTVTARALPDAQGTHTVSASTNISVSGDSFRFTAPSAGTEIVLDDPGTPGIEGLTAISVHWEKNSVPQANKEIRFATTRGTLSANSVLTDASGNATVNISSQTAGPAVITATNTEDAAAQLAIEFVADNPDKVTLQADPGVVGPNETSTITAIVFDANNNRVKNATVEFTLTDNTGGTLSTASAVTDSLGRAQTVYTASSATSADDGVTVTAQAVKVGSSTLSPNCAINFLCDDAKLTVAGRALFITFGTGNTIVIDDADTTYTKNYSLFVSDSSGKGVANARVNVRMLSTKFLKGRLRVYIEGWYYHDTLTPLECNSEDDNDDGVITDSENNGILDPGEDFNGDGELTPGNIAIVSPGTVTTDANGIATFAITYPQNYAMWAIGRITASASVAGSESRSASGFYFPAADDDLKPDVTPPNVVSPFGDNWNDINGDGAVDPGEYNRTCTDTF